MFRITQDTSSGSDNLCLNEITCHVSHVLDRCLAAYSGPVVCVCVCVCVCVRCVGLRTQLDAAHTHTPQAQNMLPNIDQAHVKHHM